MYDFKAILISGEVYNDIPEVLACLANVTNTSTPQDDSNQVRWVFVAPIIFWVGVVGNALILAVMTQTWMRGTSTSSYLIAMAVADLFVLVTGMIPDWLEANQFVALKELHPAACKIEKFLFYTSGDTAIWIRVLFTLDRFVAVCFPMSTTECCVYWKAKYYSLAALFAATLKNFHVLWTRGAEYKAIDQALIDSCLNFFGLVDDSPNSSSSSVNVSVVGLVSNCGGTTPMNKYFEAYVRPWIAFSLVSVLPFCIIVTCNLLIILTLARSKRKRAGKVLVRSSHEKHIVQLTAMCLSASFCFLVCVTPSIILLIGKPYWAKDNLSYDVAKAINNQLYYVVHSANFFLYCITGKRFRDTLVHICNPGKRKLSFASSTRSSTSYSTSLMVRRSVEVAARITNPSSADYFKVSSAIEQKDVVSSL